MAYGDSATQSFKELSDAFGGGEGHDESQGLSQGVPDLGNAFSTSLGGNGNEFRMVLTQEMAKGVDPSSVGVVAAMLNSAASEIARKDERDKEQSRSGYFYAAIAQQTFDNLNDALDALNSRIANLDEQIAFTQDMVDLIRDGTFDPETDEDQALWLQGLLEEFDMTIEDWNALSQEEQALKAEAYAERLDGQREELVPIRDQLETILRTARDQEIPEDTLIQGYVSDFENTFSVVDGAFANSALEQAVIAAELAHDIEIDRLNMTFDNLSKILSTFNNTEYSVMEQQVALNQEEELNVSDEVAQNLLNNTVTFS